MTIDIIGGGIGGLMTAIALQKKGYKIRVFEQAETIKPVGAGIVLANNAMQVCEHLGLRETIEKAGNRISSMNVTRADLRPLSAFDLKYFDEKYEVFNVAIHRADLQGILVDALQNSELFLAKALSGIRPKGDGFLLNFEDGTEVESQALIGADGIHSVVRRELFDENTIRDAGQVCWRGVAKFELPPKYQHELNEAWGNGSRFGFTRINSDTIYWFAVLNDDQSEASSQNLSDYYTNYHPLVQEMLKATPVSVIHEARLTDLKPMSAWVKKNVGLVGDAAHATTPNMGQGACQSIEDAYILAECVGKYSFNEALEKYQTLRMPKARMIVNTSWTVGKIAHIQNPVLARLRNWMMQLTPQRIGRKQSEKIFELEKV